MKAEYVAQMGTLTITLRDARIRESDELVYALYGLTPEEIKIVEKAAKWGCGRHQRSIGGTALPQWRVAPASAC